MPLGAGSLGKLREPDPDALLPPGGGALARHDAAPETDTLAWRSKVLYAAQSPRLLEDTVGEVLRRPFEFRVRRGQTFPAADAKRWLDALQLPGFERPTDHMSGGERQRVHLVRALCLRPKVLLLDEPVSALDPDRREAARTLLDEAADAGVVTIEVTHEVGDRAALEVDWIQAAEVAHG